MKNVTERPFNRLSLTQPFWEVKPPMERMSLEKGGQGGLIVNTASLAGIVKGFGIDSSSYFVAKHGVVTLTRTLGVLYPLIFAYKIL